MLFTATDISNERNLNLTSDGTAITDTLIPAVTDWASRIVGYAVEQAEQTAYFDDGHQTLFLPTGGPVTAVSLATFNDDSSDYDAVEDSAVRFSSAGAVRCSMSLPYGFQAVRATYTAGWTDQTVPGDLRGALMDLVLVKLQQINNLTDITAEAASTDSGDQSATESGPLKRVVSLGYTEEYDTSRSAAIWKAQAEQLARSVGDDVPPAILAVVLQYQRPFAV
jgi:hypothetical protein